MAPIIHAPGLGRPEFSNLVYVETDEEYLFFLPGPAKHRILRLATLPDNASASLRIAGAGPRIVRHRHAHHIVKRSCLESGGSDVVPRTDRKIPYLPEYTDFKAGKLYPNERPGLGVTLDTSPLTLIGEVTQSVRRQIYNRPDGSLTHW